MLTKKHLRIHTSKPNKKQLRKKRVYFNIERVVPNFNYEFDHYHDKLNDAIKQDALYLCYGELRNNLVELARNLMVKEQYPDQFRKELSIIDEIMGQIK